MTTRLEEVNALAAKTKDELVLLALGDCSPDAVKQRLEEHVQLRIEKALIEKGFVHG